MTRLFVFLLVAMLCLLFSAVAAYCGDVGAEHGMWLLAGVCLLAPVSMHLHERKATLAF
jgi:hypothetical protein